MNYISKSLVWVICNAIVWYMYTILYCSFFWGVDKKEKRVSHLEHDVECLLLKTSDVTLDVCSKTTLESMHLL